MGAVEAVILVALAVLGLYLVRRVVAAIRSR
jgi:hypothetical protein